MTATVRVTKRFSFDMAHALYGYDGPCKNIHGHTYHLSVTLLGKPIDNLNDVKLGMVLDFSDLKSLVHQYILSIYDHALVLNEGAPYARAEWLKHEFEKVITVPFQPTCENLLLYFVDILQMHIQDPLQLVRVQLEETPSSSAEWNLSDQ